MKKIRVRSRDVAEPADGLWSNCLRVGDTVYISGLTARAKDGTTIEGDGEYEQARGIFGKMRSLVEAAGGCMDDVVKMTIFVTRIANNVEVWKARKEVFTGDFPACSLVEVSALAKPEILVEIEAIAHIGAAPKALAGSDVLGIPPA
jgi:enamine deaminase RidA (YjgF/YER057c/UK114 family)